MSRSPVSFLRVAVERTEFPSEHALPFVGRHDRDRRRCERKSARSAVASPVGGGRLVQRSQELIPGGEHRAAPARGPVLYDLLLAGLPLVGPVPPLVLFPLRARTKKNAVAGHLDIQLVTGPSDLSVATPYPLSRCRGQEHCLIVSYLLQEPPSEEQLDGYDPLTKWEFMVPTVPKESFLPRVIKKAGPEPEA